MTIATLKLDAVPLHEVRGDGVSPSLGAAGSASGLTVKLLRAGEEEEALSALSAPSLSSLIMSGFIRDNGLVSPLNRGSFYTCRDARGELAGVALVGHTILFEARDDEAVRVFAGLAAGAPARHLLMGERGAARRFWLHHAGAASRPRLTHPVTVLEQKEPFNDLPPVPGLRRAAPEDLEQVVAAQAAMAAEMSGVNPYEKDPAGFSRRCLLRIERGRVWVLMKGGRLVFKADVITESPEAVYVEGVYVTPRERGKGHGRRCLAEAGRALLRHTRRVTLFAEEHDARVRAFYESVGYKFRDSYDLIYF